MTRPSLSWITALFLAVSAAVLTGQEPRPPLREPVHPRRNVEEFPPREARLLRFTILRTSGQEPCLDELEVYGPEAPERNLALAGLGTLARASGTYPDYRIHALPHIHDGLYGNGHSWISSTPGGGWAELEFPAPVRISRVVWSRDRERKFIDRLALEYRVEISAGPGQEWRTVASSADRRPPPEELPGSLFPFSPPGHFAAAPAPLPGNDRPAAREYLLRTWQTADGLPSNTVTSLLQTRDGWLWAGTANGPARFDGRRFTAFGESQGLRNLSITCLFEDRRGTLWAGTEGGGLAFLRDGRFHILPTGGNLADNTVLALAEDAEGTLRIATAGSLLEYRGGRLIRLTEGPVTGLAAGRDGLWLLRAGLLLRWDGRALVSAPAKLDPACFSSISALTSAPDGALWFGGANGYVGRLADGAVTTFGEGHTVLTSTAWQLLAADGGEVWMGTSSSGLARLRGHELLQLTTDDGLPSNCVRALCQDRDGCLWAGTAGGGLTRLRPRRIRTVTTHDGLSHNAIMALAEDARGAVRIGTDGGGLNRWKDGKAEPETPGYALDNQTVSALALPGDGSLWLGASGGGLFRIADGRVERPAEGRGMPGRMVTALCPDSRGDVWIGTLDGGPARFSGGVITRPAAIAALAGQPVTGILEDRAGGIWFGTSGQGVARLDPGGKLTRWTRAEGLASDFIRTLRLDSAGAVWAGTSGGLTRWGRGGELFNFTRRHGLPGVVVPQILDDEAGHLWIGTGGGVLRVPLASLDAVAAGRAETLEILALGTEDGLPALECTGGCQPAGLRTRSGLLCFGTAAGLAVIDPADFAPAPEAPPVVIESFAPGTDAPVPVTGRTLPADVPPGPARLGFEFTALAPGAPDRARFRYRLAGLEEAWTEAGPARSAVYTHPAPGDYVFEVLASAGGGPWSAAPARLALRVAAPWWRKPWALAAGFLLAAAGVAGLARAITRRRLQRSLREVERQFALERERSRIARDIHDDLGANLTQISLLSALGRQQPEDPEKVSARFAAIAATSGELVQAMDAIVWAVNPSQDNLESLARYLVRFAGDFFASGNVRLRLDVPERLPAADLSSEVRHNLFLAAKEALHNALHHADAAGVSLSLRVEDIRAGGDSGNGNNSGHSGGKIGDGGGGNGGKAGAGGGRNGDADSGGGSGPALLVVEIRDDGRGFIPDPDPHPAGNGLGNMRHRLTECGGTCVINSTPGGGTRVRLAIPLPRTA